MTRLTRAALEDLLERCTFNYVRSFVSGHEKTWAVIILRALHCEAREPFDPREIERWAGGAGWKGKDPKRLREIAEGVLSGRRFYADHRLIRYDPAQARVLVDAWREKLGG
jgi:hypothetical protein